MGSTNKFWTGVIAGAVAGGLISLLDRDTRQAVGEKTGKAAKNISYVLTHPKEIATNLKEKTMAIKNTALQISDEITYIVQKIDEVRELTPEVTGLVKDTKEAFLKEKESENEL
jgi:gas vesicle protein